MNDWLKRCVFNLDLNRESVSEPRTLLGRLFQSLGAKYEKVLPPLVDFAILGVTYSGRNSTLQVTRRGGQLKNQQPSKSPSSASAQKRAFSSCCGTKGMCGNASQRHSFISWLSKHPQRNIWILMCTLSLICLWNMNINLGKRGLISNRALTWNV